ncbi:hypothetical protein [Rossellomorea marisflavi]|uniref:hypothetical protein n=1 Tax=Rossellomorea marisflavi TaxID=189381 RepID=UPI003FA08D8A
MKPLMIRNNRYKDKYSSYPKHLRYGKSYYFAFAGITLGFTFTLSKAKKVRCEWIDGTVTYEDVKWIKRLLTEDFGSSVHFISEFEKENVG